MEGDGGEFFSFKVVSPHWQKKGPVGRWMQALQGGEAEKLEMARCRPLAGLNEGREGKRLH